MGVMGYSCLIRLVPTYILRAIETRLLGSLETSLRRNGKTADVRINGRTWLDRLV